MDHTIFPKYQTIEIKNTSKTSRKSFDSIMMFGIVFLGPKNLKQFLRSLRYDNQKLRFWIRLAAILNYGGHLVLINIVLCIRCNSLKLNIYYQAFKSSFYPK